MSRLAPLYFSIGLLSAAVLGYEILLLRLFSVVLWHHFAATAISLALLGYGASGALLSLVQEPLRRHFRAAYGAGAVLFGLAGPACWAVSQRVPFTPLALAWEPQQWLHFTLLYVILSLPFLCAALSLGLAFRHLGGRIPQLYRADLLGAGLGAILVLGLLAALPPESCLRGVTAAGFTAAALASYGAPPPGRSRRLPAGAVLAFAGVLLALAWPEGWLAPRLSQYKDLSRLLQVQGTRVVARETGPLGRITAVASPEIPLRHAPGLSLACPAPVPEQLGLFRDGNFLGALDASAGTPPAYLDCLPGALPYALLDEPRVLVLGASSGTEVATALRHGAGMVEVVEPDRTLLALLRGPLAPFSGDLFGRPPVRLHSAAPRTFLATDPQPYDLIVAAFADTAGHPLGEDYLYTVEALGAALARLRPGGVLAITRPLQVPPRGSLKLFATAVAALEAAGRSAPGEHLAVVRTWNTATLLLGERAFSDRQLAGVREFCRIQGCDLVHLPDLEAAETNHRNRLPQPYLYEGTRELLGPDRDALLDRYKFAIRPATDDRPYFHRFFRWRSLPELLAARSRGGAGLLEWGYLLGVVTVLQALAAGAVLIVLPLRWLGGHTRSARRPAGIVFYFSSLGLAFILVEVATLGRLGLLLGHPVAATAVTLATFLIGAGVGAGASGRLLAHCNNRHGQLAATAALAAAVLALACPLLVSALTPALAGWPLAARAGLAAAASAPLAFAMGMPFPLGLARVARRAPAWVPWAWGVNGFAAVWGAALAPLLAVHLGSFGVLGVGACLYLGAAWRARGWQ